MRENSAESQVNLGGESLSSKLGPRTMHNALTHSSRGQLIGLLSPDAIDCASAYITHQTKTKRTHHFTCKEGKHWTSSFYVRLNRCPRKHLGGPTGYTAGIWVRRRPVVWRMLQDRRSSNPAELLQVTCTIRVESRDMHFIVRKRCSYRETWSRSFSRATKAEAGIRCDENDEPMYGHGSE